ncbi:MAG: hypothetical protein CMF31_05660 [Kordiimonas sp.]|nr:hypothetical protein [Kordiimonas sp.]|tara:strand:+ start:697 stop:1467 length:771 start_codon:yes stop_codon:yes gene_type:complete
MTKDENKVPTMMDGQWSRLLFVVMFGIIYHVVEVLVWVIFLVQFVLRLVMDKPNDKLQALGDSLGSYARQIIRVLTYRSDVLPYPFAEWPTPEPESEPDAGKEDDAAAEKTNKGDKAATTKKTTAMPSSPGRTSAKTPPRKTATAKSTVKKAPAKKTASKPAVKKTVKSSSASSSTRSKPETKPETKPQQSKTEKTATSKPDTTVPASSPTGLKNVGTPKAEDSKDKNADGTSGTAEAPSSAGDSSQSIQDDKKQD